MIKNKHQSLAFTLIELLVVISIIGILLAISVFSIQNARKSSRDARRKSDLETIRSGLEMYRADCGSYPVNDDFLGGSLVGDAADCNGTEDVTYIEEVPEDPIPDTYSYTYTLTTSGYTLGATLENETPSAYQVKNP